MKRVLTYSSILSGVYTVYSIGKEIYPYLKELNLRILVTHMASVVIVLIFIGSTMILLYQWCRGKFQEINRIKDENKNLRDENKDLKDKLKGMLKAYDKMYDVDTGILDRIIKK